jgi:hypothetical protein
MIHCTTTQAYYSNFLRSGRPQTIGVMPIVVGVFTARIVIGRRKTNSIVACIVIERITRGTLLSCNSNTSGSNAGSKRANQGIATLEEIH